jgi:hypothetical protein
MAYTFIDQQTALNDWPWSSAHFVRAREALLEVGTERFYKTGTSFRDGQRWCSLYPAPWGVFWIYVPERTSEVKVRLRVPLVDFTGETNGTDAIDLFATTLDPTGYYGLPPDPEAWASVGGVTLEKTATAQTVTLTAPLAGNGNNWVGVVIWTRSRVGGQDETGDVVGFGLDGGIQLDSTTLSSGVPEKALILLDPWLSGAKTASFFDSRPKMIGYLNRPGASGTAGYAWVCPPARVSPLDNATATWETREVGVVEVSGVALEVHPGGPDLPTADAYFIGKRCSSGVHQGIISGARGSIPRNRIPTWKCAHHGYVNGPRELWFIHGDDMSPWDPSVAMDTAGYDKMSSVLIPTEIPDSNGYHSIVSMWGVAHEDSVSALNVQTRLHAQNATTGATIGSAGGDLTTILPSTSGDIFGGPYQWDPMMQTVAGVSRWDDWQFRGCLLGTPHDWGYTLSRLVHHQNQISESSLTYPFDLVLEGQLNSQSSPRNRIVVVGVGCASAPRAYTLT